MTVITLLRLMRAIKLLVVAGVVAVGMVAGIAALSNDPAKASHTRYHCTTFAYHPTDNSWTCATDPAGWYKACDYHVDGHRVRGHIDVAGSATDDRYTAWAPSQGCTEPAGVSYGGIYILRIRSCTEHEGCSAWRQVH